MHSDDTLQQPFVLIIVGAWCIVLLQLVPALRQLVVGQEHVTRFIEAAAARKIDVAVLQRHGLAVLPCQAGVV